MKNKEKEIKLNELKKCIKCCSLKDVNDFHNNKTRKDGKQKYCKLCCKSSFEIINLNIKQLKTIYFSLTY